MDPPEHVCPPAPHVLEAYNHKVNHNTHKELVTQECAVVQYAQALQYTSFCNNAKYRDRLAPTVCNFWKEVVKPFGSRALYNMDPAHLLGDYMCLNCGAKIPDYGVCEHIAFICAPFFEGIESQVQYKQRRNRQEESCQAQLAGGDNHSHSCTPNTKGWEHQSQSWTQSTAE